MTWTHTSRGRPMDLLDPQPDDVDLHEIARALSHQCRYNGNCKAFYSVAEHSVHVSNWLRKQGHPAEVQLAGLLHDAAEAYTGDLTWPMQQVLFGDRHGPGRSWSSGAMAKERYRETQARIDALICTLVGLDSSLLHHPAVKEADTRILLDERNVLLNPCDRRWYPEEQGMGPLGVTLQMWRPELAEFRFSTALARVCSVAAETNEPIRAALTLALSLDAPKEP